MVVPSKDLEHPFSKRKQKRSEQSETSNPPTDKPVNKPVQNKKPFTNLMSMAPNKPKTFEPPKRRIQKAGDTKKGVEMEQPKTVSSKSHLSPAMFGHKFYGYIVYYSCYIKNHTLYCLMLIKTVSTSTPLLSLRKYPYFGIHFSPELQNDANYVQGDRERCRDGHPG